MSWQSSRLITLLTDFGVDDTYVGQMHGVLHQVAAPAQLQIIDLTHSIPPQDTLVAAFHLFHSYPYFPAGTVHVAVVDPGVGTQRRILVARHEDHVFLAPDNGLLAPILAESDDVRSLDLDRFALARRSATFHGRDIFSPAAARIALGLDPAETGPRVSDWVRSSFPAVREVTPQEFHGVVLLVDRFGNLITNVPGTALDGPLEEWTAAAAGRIFPVARTYSDVEAGEVLALVDSFGCLEVAVHGGSAAARLGLAAGAAVVFKRRT
jgi:S-adenosylmethionine hydrolase